MVKPEVKLPHSGLRFTVYLKIALTCDHNPCVYQIEHHYLLPPNDQLMLVRSQFGTCFFCFCGLGCSSVSEISLQ